MTADRQRILATDAAGIVALAMITAALYFAAVRPIAAHRRTLHERTTELASLRTELEHLASARQADQQRIVALRRECDAMTLRLEPADRLNAAMGRIVEIASACGLQIHESRSGDVVPGERFDTVPIGLSGLGRFPACIEFLHRGTAALGDVNLLTFELRGSPAAAAAGATFEFELEWYALSAAGAEASGP